MKPTEDKLEVPQHIQEYIDLVHRVMVWCVARSKLGDVDPETVARQFTENVIKQIKMKYSQ
jgi:hypothetical protein